MIAACLLRRRNETPSVCIYLSGSTGDLSEPDDGFPRHSQLLVIGALVVVLAAFILLMAPVAYHRIADRGENRPDLNSFVLAIMQPTLPLFALSMGLTLYIATEKVDGVALAAICSVTGAGLALMLWYRVGAGRKKRPGSSSQIEIQAGPARREEPSWLRSGFRSSPRIIQASASRQSARDRAKHRAPDGSSRPPSHCRAGREYGGVPPVGRPLHYLVDGAFGPRDYRRPLRGHA